MAAGLSAWLKSALLGSSAIRPFGNAGRRQGDRTSFRKNCVNKTLCGQSAFRGRLQMSWQGDPADSTLLVEVAVDGRMRAPRAAHSRAVEVQSVWWYCTYGTRP